jgi:hypothetical protein
MRAFLEGPPSRAARFGGLIGRLAAVHDRRDSVASTFFASLISEPPSASSRRSRPAAGG